MIPLLFSLEEESVYGKGAKKQFEMQSSLKFRHMKVWVICEHFAYLNFYAMFFNVEIKVI